MDLTVADVRGLGLAGMEKVGKPDCEVVASCVERVSPFRASSEITAPAVVFLAPAISLAALSTLSSISRVVLMVVIIYASDAVMSKVEEVLEKSMKRRKCAQQGEVLPTLCSARQAEGGDGSGWVGTIIQSE